MNDSGYTIPAKPIGGCDSTHEYQWALAFVNMGWNMWIHPKDHPFYPHKSFDLGVIKLKTGLQASLEDEQDRTGKRFSFSEVYSALETDSFKNGLGFLVEVKPWKKYDLHFLKMANTLSGLMETVLDSPTLLLVGETPSDWATFHRLPDNNIWPHTMDHSIFEEIDFCV